MNEILQERLHIKHCKQPPPECESRQHPRITRMRHRDPHAPVRAPLKRTMVGPAWLPTGPPRRRPLRGGSRPSGRPHDERPPLHGDRTPPPTPSRLHALRRAHARPPASLCLLAAAPRGLLLHGAARRGGSCLGRLGAAVEAEEEIDMVLTIAPIRCLRARAGEA